MSKKIISAILVMAMVISMSATALLSSVGAAAETETNYQADVDTLTTMLREFVVEGPALGSATIEYLKTLGIIQHNGDLNCDDGCGEYVQLHNRNSFWKEFGGLNLANVNDYFFLGEDETFAKNFVEKNETTFNNLFKNTGLVWNKVPAADETFEDVAMANIALVIEYAASAVYFGKNADDANPDASFNAGRNEVVKKATSMVKALNAALAAEVTGTDKPAAYADRFDGEWYRGFATMSKAYNQSIGFNPYLFILTSTTDEDYYVDNYYNSVLNQYTVRWYTFAEAREIDKEGVFAFENAIRTMAIDNCAGVLFYDFINDKNTPFLDIVKSLFENLVGKVEADFVDVDIDNQIKAFLKLKLIVENIYDLYIKDVYNNIYSATAAELLNDVLYAKRVIDFIEKDNTNYKLVALTFADFETLIADILAGINAVAPRAEQLLTATEITNGTALVRKAEALLNNWSNWASNDDYKGTWNALNNAKNALKNMLPAAEGEKAIVIINAGVDKLKNFAGTEIFNDKIAVEFAPNFFAYIKLTALLEDQIDAFIAKVNGVNGSLSAPNLEATSLTALRDGINKYAYLIGIVGNIVTLSADEKSIVFVDTTDADGKATAQFRATVKYMSYLFDSNPNDYTTVGGPARDAHALPAYPFVSSLAENAPASVNSDIYSDTFCYVAKYYADNYLQLLYGTSIASGIIDTAYISNNDDVVDSIYELVLGSVDGNNEYAHANGDKTISQDVAIDSVYVLMHTIWEAAKYAVEGTTSFTTSSWTDSNTALWDWTADYKFDSEGKFDWVNDKYVFTSGNEKAINAIVNAVKNLTKDLTTEIQTYTAIMQSVANLFGWELTETGYTSASVTTWCKHADHFSKDAMKNALKATNALAQHISDTIVNGDGKNIYIYTTASKLVAAYDAFVNAIKTYLFTDAGSAKFDEFVEDVYYYTESYLGKDANNAWNEYDKLLQKLQASGININNYYLDQVNCYQYFAVTLAHVATCDRFFGNRYNAANGTLEANLVKPLSDHIATMDVTGYTRDWAEKYNSVRQIAAGVVAACKDTAKSDMPVWYAERVLAECNNIKAEAADYTTAKLVEYKAGLEALLIEADTLNVYNYVSNTDEAKAIWADFVEAYANAQYVALDGRCPFADVDAAVEALTAAMAELEKIEAPEGASTVDTLNAKIAAAEALLARADVVELAEEAELVLAINAAKKALQFNTSVLNSTDLDAQIKAIDDIMNAIVKEMYTGADLKKAAKVLELQVVVDLYTEASYRKFANALEAAYAMAEEDTATESAMMAAAANVEARFGDLKLAPVEEEPEVVEPEVSVVMTEAIEIYNNAANGYDKAVEGCTAESAAAYNAAINTLKADIEANADDAKLLESIIALNLAKAALTVDVPETCDC